MMRRWDAPGGQLSLFCFSLSIALGICLVANCPADLRAAEPSSQEEEVPPVDFVRDVQPILTGKCIRCHGPEEREGQLRLDAKVAVYRGGVTGPLFEREKPAESSLLYRRVAGIGDDDQMPPEGEKLTDRELALVRNWIRQGAPWPDGVGARLEPDTPHWAYQKPTRPELPVVRQTAWPQSPVDHFILARLEQEGLAPTSEADRAKLLRRVSLDLIGLPPTLEQLDAFLADKRPNAYELAVDRLLESQHYGERWARHWLDLARYADSNGYQADQYRNVWPYRDWVISALNRDMPFSQFTIEQLAGDLLPDATQSQRIATGFHRSTTCNVEAGTDPEENRVNQVIDRVNTTASVWLGTTLECAQCHHHKYDPFTQQDYYRIFAYFNNTPLEVKLTSGVTYDFVGPKMDCTSPETEEQRDLLSAELDRRRQQLAALKKLAAREVSAWEAKRGEPVAEPVWQVAPVTKFHAAGGASHELLADGSVLVGGQNADVETYTLTLDVPTEQITGIKLEALTDPSLPGAGPGRNSAERPNFVLSEIKLFATAEQASDKKPAKQADKQEDMPGDPIGLHAAAADFAAKGFEPARAIDGDLKTGWAIHDDFFKPHTLTAHVAGGSVAVADRRLTLVLEQRHAPGKNLGRVRVSFTSDPWAVADLPEKVAEALGVPKPKRSDAQQAAIVEYYAGTRPDVVKLQAEIADVEKRIGDLPTISTLVMVEMDTPRPTHVLKRGDFLNPAEQVQPGPISSLLKPRAEFPANRLGLARWLVDRDHPLTARVAVNRWWQEIFGRGLVATSEDFGLQGDPPTHPELLDWLAVELMENNWSMKHLLKQIVMSATYRQSSRVSPELLERDADNQLYARGPRFRMSAETIRDNALQAAGLLSNKLGGEPVFPPQPDGVWRHVGRNAPKYLTSSGEDRFRRGIYVIWRRSAPYVSFVNFDAPDRASCVIQRPRTNTPLQALTLLNDPAYIEIAQALAGQMLAAPTAAAGDRPTAAERIAQGFRRCVARRPDADELKHLVALYEEELARFRESPARAKAVLGNAKLNPGEDPAELAALFYVANVLLNLDETITKG